MPAGMLPHPQAVAVQSPAVGVNVTITPSEEAATRLVSLVSTFAASSAGTARSITATVTDLSGLVVYQTGVQAAQLVSSTRDYVLSTVFVQNNGSQGLVNPGNGLPWPDFWLPAGWQLSLVCVNVQPADQWSNIAFMAEFHDRRQDQAEQPTRVLRIG